MNIKRILKGGAYALCAVIFALFLKTPAVTGRYVTEGVTFCINVMLPSLFLSLVFARLLLGKLMSVSGRFLPAAVILAGVLCGFPVGAKTVRTVYECGSISKKQAEVLNSCGNSASLSFALSFAGAGILGSVKAGLWLVAGELLSAFIWYFAASLICLKKEERVFRPVTGSRYVTLTEAVCDAAKSMAYICAFIVFFMCVSRLVCSYIGNGEYATALISGILELCCGIGACSALPVETAYVIVSVLLGWSGLCVHMQVSYALGREISIKPYIFGKLFSCAFMAAFGVLTKSLAV